MSSRSLDDLYPKLRPIAVEFIKRCAAKGIDVLIYCTWRSNDEQAELYALGRSKPGAIITNAGPGKSAHNYMIDGKPAAKAWDCVPLKNGKALWGKSAPEWQVMGGIGAELGLYWYGAPGSKFKEYPHFQLKE